MTWKAKFEFRIFDLFRVPPQNMGAWEIMCAMGSLGQLAYLAKTSFNLINTFCFLLSPRPVCPKDIEGKFYTVVKTSTPASSKAAKTEPYHSSL